MSSFASLAKAAQSQQAALLAQQKAEADAQARKLAETRKAEQEKLKQIAEQRAKQLQAIERAKQELEAQRVKRERAERERAPEYKEKQDLKKRLNGTSRGTESPKPSAPRLSGNHARARSSTPVGMTVEEKRRAYLERQARDSPQRKSANRSGKSLPGLGSGEIRVVNDPHAVSLGTSTGGSDGLTARQRLAMLPPTLTKLNVNKRDLRGPAEVQAELQRARIAAGVGDPEGFREEKKREELERRERAMRAKQERLAGKRARPSSAVMSEEEAGHEVGEQSDGGRKEKESRKEKERTKEREMEHEKEKQRDREREREKQKEKPKDMPLTAQLKANGPSRAALSAGVTSSPRLRDKPLTSVVPVPRAVSTSQSSTATLKGSSVSNFSSKTAVNGSGKPVRTFDPKHAPTSSSSSLPVKRKRSSSEDEPSDDEGPRQKQSRRDASDRPRDRDRDRRERDMGLHGEARKELDDVLSMFRRGRQRRWSDDSDDDDMEVTGEELWREEKKSEKVAKLEDEREAMAEKRHEEEKRRKRMEKVKGGN
ncbi:hypothetical protein CALCODRAFT_501317 [Calocera cornea HHB12733]|uniref:SPT2-domain-containing protein n=1 Tax=Calocera cornea HHB12733 TaxID=1353952 RepID=A0A165DPL3_9BASI|nr:hypothetical protein CALCODRAFT_501317 [Calocera cornea HHB12733]